TALELEGGDVVLDAVVVGGKSRGAPEVDRAVGPDEARAGVRGTRVMKKRSAHKGSACGEKGDEVPHRRIPFRRTPNAPQIYSYRVTCQSFEINPSAPERVLASMTPLLAILGAIMAILLAALVLRRRTRRHKCGERN